METTDVAGDIASVLLTEQQIRDRIAEMCRQIEAEDALVDDGTPLLLVGVLKGAVMVMADLARELRIPVQMDWMAVSSYGSSTRSSGVVRILKDLDAELEGRRVLIVEDILDSGLTLSWLVENLRSRGPRSVQVCTLLVLMAFDISGAPLDLLLYAMAAITVGSGVEVALRAHREAACQVSSMPLCRR